MRVGQSRVSDRGQTKCKHCIVISERLGIEVFDTEGSDSKYAELGSRGFSSGSD